MSQITPILFTFRRCPYAIRVRYTFALLEIPYQPVEVDLKHKPQELLAISPKGTVPVLQLPGQVIEQSYEIMQWALLQCSDHSLYPPKQVAAIDAWVNRNDYEFKPILDGYKYPERNLRSEEHYWERCLSWMGEIESQLEAGSLFETRTLADIALFPFVRQCRGVNQELFDQEAPPKVRVWLASFLEDPLFERVMAKKP